MHKYITNLRKVKKHFNTQKNLDEAVNFNVISQKIDPANPQENIYKEKKDFKNALLWGIL